MEVVVDANILIAAFLKAALTRTLFLDERLELFAPEHLLSETRKVIRQNPRLIKRTGLSIKEREEVFNIITRRIKVVKKREYRPFLQQALALAAHEEDAPYLAVALRFKIPIWSNDTDFDEQNAVRVYSTRELARMLGLM